MPEHIALTAAVSAFSVLIAINSTPLTEGRFGNALALKNGRKLILSTGGIMRKFPVTYELWFRLDSSAEYNILLSQAPKFGAHWKLFTSPGEGRLFLWIPQMSQQDIGGSEPVADGKWHFAAVRFHERSVELYVDGKLVVKRETASRMVFDDSPLIIGGIANDILVCDGAVDELHISRRTDNLEDHIPKGPSSLLPSTIHLLRFDKTLQGRILDDMPKSKAEGYIVDKFTRLTSARFLDEVQEEEFAVSSLYGDDKVEEESKLPIAKVACKRTGTPAENVKPEVISLSGEWLMKDCDPREDRLGMLETVIESPGLKEGWHKPGFDRRNWYKVTVPTSVQSALIELGKLDDPHWATNTYDELDKFGEPKTVPWMNRRTRIEQKDWWFAKKFRVPESWKGKHVVLHFDGIDYGGSVYLNGKSLGYHVGMFGGPTREVSQILNYGGDNELVVRLDRAANHWDGRLKGSPGWGWHYGHLISIGIWKDVTLSVIPEITISSPYVVTKSIEKNNAKLQIEYYIDSRTPRSVDVTVTGTIRGANFKSQEFSFTNRAKASYGRTRWQTVVNLPDPKLWWPLNYGDQHMYTLRLTASVSSQPVHTVNTRFGIRTIEMWPATGAMPEKDYKWQFVINGQPMFIKGANWCWSDPMLECDPAKYERILELARRAGIQMFRAWGGGIIETDIFYDKCDEKGLMVYQEFPFCWGPPDFPGTNAQLVDQQVSAVVKRLRNHPSLVMWGGGNENVTVGHNNDEGLFLVGRRCRQYDPSRPFHRTDPWGGSTHNWSVYHHGNPMDKHYYSFDSVFYGEYGIPSMTNRSSCLKYLPESELEKWPMDDSRHALIAHMHQFSSRDPLKTLKYADYGPIRDWNTYIEYSQMAQGDWLRFAAEGQRSCSGQNKTGFWFYKFTDLFPGHSWAVVDYYGSPKLSYYRAKQTCLPRCAFATYKKLDWADGETFMATIHVANDTPASFSGAKTRVTLYGSDLLELWSKEYLVPTLKPNERVELELISVDVPPDKDKPFILAVGMYDSAGKTISDQWYWFNYKAKTEKVKELDKLPAWSYPEDKFAETYAAYAEIPEARLLNLPKTKLSVTTKISGRKGVFVIRNIGKVPAFNVIIDNFPDSYSDFLDDNSFFLRPGEEKEVAFELGEGSSIEKVSVRAWNVPEAVPAL